MSSPLLKVDNLYVRFRIGHGYIHAVNGISFDVSGNETVAIVGESGCGKTTVQLAVMRLISYPGEIISGKILFEGKDLLQLSAKGREMAEIRGQKISMIFQEPTCALNPVLTIGSQMTEMLEKHLCMNISQAKAKSKELLSMVKITNAEDRLKSYPHQLSGGMLQRIMIAMALSCSPSIVIADEPTSALDATTQAYVLDLLNNLILHFNSSMILVTHNLNIVARYAQRILIMYAGQIVESGNSKDIFNNPYHPYTIGLINSLPKLNDERFSSRRPIKGSPPNLSDVPGLCTFLPRCDYSYEECEQIQPLKEVGVHHYARCCRQI